MAGTRTAPTVDGSPTKKRISIAYIDDSGDLRSDSIYAPAGTLDTAIEALVAACVAGSRASVWKVEVTEVYEGTQSKANAEAEVYEDVHDNMVWLLKDTGVTVMDWFVPAPIYPDMFDTSGEQPDPTDGLVSAITTAVDALWGTVTTRSIRFSKRQDRGKRVKL